VQVTRVTPRRAFPSPLPSPQVLLSALLLVLSSSALCVVLRGHSSAFLWEFCLSFCLSNSYGLQIVTGSALSPDSRGAGDERPGRSLV
jgi:hypothetical protein